MSECVQNVCDPQGLCLLQQQLMAASIQGFQNLVSTTHNQDLAYLQDTKLMLLAVLGNPRIFINPEAG